MSLLAGAQGFSYFQIVGLFLALAGSHFACTVDIEGISPIASFARAFVTVRGYAAIALLSAAAIVMVWPATGIPDKAIALFLILVSALVVGGFAFVLSWKSR